MERRRRAAREDDRLRAGRRRRISRRRGGGGERSVRPPSGLRLRPGVRPGRRLPARHERALPRPRDRPSDPSGQHRPLRRFPRRRPRPPRGAAAAGPRALRPRAARHARRRRAHRARPLREPQHARDRTGRRLVLLLRSRAGGALARERAHLPARRDSRAHDAAARHDPRRSRDARPAPRLPLRRRQARPPRLERRPVVRAAQPLRRLGAGQPLPARLAADARRQPDRRSR